MKKTHHLHYVLLSFFLFLCILYSISIGRFELGFIKVLAALKFPFLEHIPLDSMEESVVINIRLPRVLVAIFVGGMLSVSGAVLQGVFHNPLVGPQLLGTSAGAAFGGVIAILFGLSLFFMVCISFLSGILSLFMTLCIEKISKLKGTLTLILGGIVVGAFFSALVSIIKFAADPDDQLPAIVFWLLGSLVGTSYNDVLLIVVVCIISMTVIIKARYSLNVLSIGDEDAQVLGIDIRKARIIFLFSSTAMISVTVAIVGIVGWVGQMIPHICRFMFGSDYRHLIITSFLFGASYMVLVDAFARNTSYGEIPVGVITALLGAPIFAYLICKQRK